MICSFSLESKRWDGFERGRAGASSNTARSVSNRSGFGDGSCGRCGTRSARTNSGTSGVSSGSWESFCSGRSRSVSSSIGRCSSTGDGSRSGSASSWSSSDWSTPSTSSVGSSGGGSAATRRPDDPASGGRLGRATAETAVQGSTRRGSLPRVRRREETPYRGLYANAARGGRVRDREGPPARRPRPPDSARVSRSVRRVLPVEPPVKYEPGAGERETTCERKSETFVVCSRIIMFIETGRES